jgi:hypothetical protein
VGYTIFLNFEKENIQQVYEGLQKIGDILFADNVFYIWLDEKKNKNSILSVLRKAGVKDFFLSEFKEDMIDNTHNSFVAIWLREHYNDLMIKKFEAEKEQ